MSDISITKKASYDLSGKGISLTSAPGGKLGFVDSDGNSLSLEDVIQIGSNRSDPEMDKMSDLRKSAVYNGCRDGCRDIRQQEMESPVHISSVVYNGCRDGCRDIRSAP